MKRAFQTILTLSVAALLLAGCDKREEYYYNYWYSYGNIIAHNSEDIGEGYSIQLDNGWMLLVEVNNVPYAEVVDGERVIANYTRLSKIPNGNVETYTIQLNGLRKVLDKEPVLQSDIDDDEELEELVGNDPVNVDLAWLGGKYLNIEFFLYKEKNTDRTHYINLVRDDTRVNDAGDDTVYLTLKHNASGDTPTEATKRNFVEYFSYVSFDLTSLVPAGKTSVPIKVTWEDYGSSFDNTIIRSDDGTFTLSNIRVEPYSAMTTERKDLEHRFFEALSDVQ